MATRSLVIVCNGSRARVYALGADTLTLRCELEHPQGRARETDLGTDRPGRQQNDTPGFNHRSGYGKQVSPHRQELTAFAREIRDEVARQRRETGIASVAVFAPPQMLGELRGVFGDNDVSAWVNRDYTATSEQALLSVCREQGLPGARVPTLV
jgi:protein required for attachment to host cells